MEFLIKSILLGEEEFVCSFDPAVSKGELFQIALISEKEIEIPANYILKIEDLDKNEILIRITLDNAGSENVPIEILFVDDKRY